MKVASGLICTIVLLLILSCSARSFSDGHFDRIKKVISEEPAKAEREIRDYYSAFVQQNDIFGMARAAYLMGELCLFRAELYHAAWFYGQSKKIFQYLDEYDFVARVNTGLGSVFLAIGDFKESEQFYRSSLEYYMRSGDSLGQAYAFFNIATLAVHRGEIHSALMYYNLTEKYFSASGDNSTVTRIHIMKGYLLFISGEVEKGIEHLKKALPDTRQLNDKMAEQGVLTTLGFIMQSIDELDSAKYYYDQAYVLSAEVRNWDINREIHEELAAIYSKQDSLEQANFHLQESMRFEDSLESSSVVNEIYHMELGKSETEPGRINKIWQQSLFWVIITILIFVPIAFSIAHFVKSRSFRVTQSGIELTDEFMVKLETKNRELLSKNLHINRQQELIQKIEQELGSLRRTQDGTEDRLGGLLSSIRSSGSDSYWDEFDTSFNELHRDFYRNLNQKYPNLTANERRLCGLISLNLSNKEISQITQKSIRSIEVARYRMRKKMKLETNQNLVNVLADLAVDQS